MNPDDVTVDTTEQEVPAVVEEEEAETSDTPDEDTEEEAEE